MKLVLPIPYQEDCHWLKIQHWFSAPLPEILAVGRTPKTKGKEKENKYTHVITGNMIPFFSQFCIEPQGRVGFLSLLRRLGDKWAPHTAPAQSSTANHTWGDTNGQVGLPGASPSPAAFQDTSEFSQSLRKFLLSIQTFQLEVLLQPLPLFWERSFIFT